MSKFRANSTGKSADEHAIGVALVNLGSPEAPTPSAVKRFLGEFLADPRVVELPRWAWLPLLHGVILQRRPRQSAKNYAKIWTRNGSPLIDTTHQLAKKLSAALPRLTAQDIKVISCMRYGKPSITSALDAFEQAGIQRVLVLPLYPQYSGTTTASVFDAVADVYRQRRVIPRLRMVPHYYQQSSYLSALTNTIKHHRDTTPDAGRLLFSFHGIPVKCTKAGDPYAEQCHRTARSVANRLRLDDEDWSISFQSRFGKQRWLTPYTDRVLKQWAKDGLENISVVCPGFAIDCLETLEEIDITNRQVFLNAGGKVFHYIPALNASDEHVNALVEILGDECKDWLSECASQSVV